MLGRTRAVGVHLAGEKGIAAPSYPLLDKVGRNLGGEEDPPWVACLCSVLVAEACIWGVPQVVGGVWRGQGEEEMVCDGLRERVDGEWGVGRLGSFFFPIGEATAWGSLKGQRCTAEEG